MVRDPDIDIVIELIGGDTRSRSELVLAGDRDGKHVVTANKALLATHGNEIFAARPEEGRDGRLRGRRSRAAFPIIKALREGLTANRIEWIAGIINGTCNFILSEMRDKGLPFDSGARRRRRRLGYAEADPDLRHRGRRRRRTSSPSWRRSPSASRCSSTGATRRASRSSPQADIKLRRAARLPHQAAGHHAADDARASSCACTRR